MTVPAPPADLASVASVTSSALHSKTRAAMARVAGGEWLAVTHYNRVEGYLVPPSALEELTRRALEARTRETELRETLPLVLAAARAGVALPSEALERVLPGLDASWRAIAELAASVPLRLSRGEHDEPLARGRLRSTDSALPEFGDDDELDLDA